MGRKTLFLILTVVILLVPSIQPVFAQAYSFSVDMLDVHVYMNEDGKADLDYTMVFTNNPGAHLIEYVDIGMPTTDYSLLDISASINGMPIAGIQFSEYVDGVTLVLGSNSIPAGSSGTVQMTATGVGSMLYIADDEAYASFMFAPSWFEQQFVTGNTDITVTFHLPPGIQPDEPRWFESPSGWPQEEPITGTDSSGRIIYSWHNSNANSYTPYVFGAAIPQTYVPAADVQTPTVSQRLGIDEDACVGFLCFGGFAAFFIGIVALGVYSSNRRKMKYLSPKISIEGHGIKRGLTAIESAILLEKPLDTIMTMILFGVIKKEAAEVTNEDPLKVKVLQPVPEDLREYEKTFLEAMEKTKKPARDRALQKVMTQLIKSVQKKMKGFSLKDTTKYYKSIVQKAWVQVEQAATPEVKSERYADNLEWTMLDQDFDDRTQRTFRSGPVFVPMWGGAYRPSYRSSAPAMPSSGTPKSVSVSTGQGGHLSLPTLPGSTFAASVVGGIQNTAGGLVSNLTKFTGGVTNKTNPIPKSTSSGGSRSSGGGSSCACACACAGCACACAGGGR